MGLVWFWIIYIVTSLCRWRHKQHSFVNEPHFINVTMCNMKLGTCWRRNMVMLEMWEDTHIFCTRQTEAIFSSFRCPEQPSLIITGERLEPRLGKFRLPWLIFFAPWFPNLWSFWTFKRKKLHGFQIWSTVVNNVLFYNPCVICCWVFLCFF